MIENKEDIELQVTDPDKRQCPEKNCDKYLKKSKNKYVECENGHKYCFECLRPWHNNDSCEKSLETDFLNLKKNKNIKRCPKCKIYTEKNERCNYMTCSNCKFEWCWLCEEQYIYGHYNHGKCKDLEFSNFNSIEEARIIPYTPDSRFKRCYKRFCEFITECPSVCIFLICILCGCERAS